MFRLIGAVLALGCTLVSATAACAQATASSGWADVDGGRLWYETCGSGPSAVVLVHDGILHSAGFDPIWPNLCARFRVLRYDRRGYGRSPAAQAPYSAVEDLAAVMRMAGVTHASLVGGSFGGGLAIDFALAHPDAVEKLLLIGPLVSGFRVSDHFRDRTLATVGAWQRGGAAEALKDRWFLAPGDEAARAKALALLTANPQNLSHADPQRPPPPAAPRLRELRAPMLIVVGEDDIPDVHAWAGALEAAAPDAHRVVIEGAGHVVYFEQPDAFLAAAIPFLDRH